MSQDTAPARSLCGKTAIAGENAKSARLHCTARAEPLIIDRLARPPGAQPGFGSFAVDSSQGLSFRALSNRDRLEVARRILGPIPGQKTPKTPRACTTPGAKLNTGGQL